MRERAVLLFVVDLLPLWRQSIYSIILLVILTLAFTVVWQLFAKFLFYYSHTSHLSDIWLPKAELSLEKHTHWNFLVKINTWWRKWWRRKMNRLIHVGNEQILPLLSVSLPMSIKWNSLIRCYINKISALNYQSRSVLFEKDNNLVRCLQIFRQEYFTNRQRINTRSKWKSNRHSPIFLYIWMQNLI